jgi:hypothetical protein
MGGKGGGGGGYSSDDPAMVDWFVTALMLRPRRRATKNTKKQWTNEGDWYAHHGQPNPDSPWSMQVDPGLGPDSDFNTKVFNKIGTTPPPAPAPAPAPQPGSCSPAP